MHARALASTTAGAWRLASAASTAALATSAASSGDAGTAQQQAPTLKAALRELYKRVHPDLFSDHPAERDENERSFKLLQVLPARGLPAAAGGA
jgi:hypothetical protein